MNAAVRHVTVAGRLKTICPEVVEYELVDEPGHVLGYRPDGHTHPAPDTLADRGRPRPLGRPYRILIHDLATYQRLRRSGALDDPIIAPADDACQRTDSASAEGATAE